MDTTLILFLVIVCTCILCIYAIKEGQRIENHKKFMKNMRDHDERSKK
jgi:hypothetical protein